MQLTTVMRGRATRMLAQQGNTEHKALLMGLAQNLGHVMNEEPDSWLGKLGSIKHTNHPKLWWQWFKWVATPNNWPRGVAINPKGFPNPWHIHGFRHLMPIVHHPRHESMSADEHQWQRWGVAKLLSILAIPGWYKNLLSWYNITIDPQLSWEGHAFHKNMGEVVCTQLLDKRGLTLDEADNCHEFAYACIQESNTPQEKDAQLHILLSSATARADSLPTFEPWCELVLHRFDETHARWCQSYRHLYRRQATRILLLWSPQEV